MSSRRELRSLFIGFTSFFACTLAGRALLPRFELPGSSLKLGEVHRQAEDSPYDTLFLGSSRSWRAFDPETFDERVARAGGRTHSFNFGIEGMAGLGSWQLLERMAEDPPPGLKWILIDPEALYKDARGHHALGRGIVGWHTPRATSILCRLAWQADAPLEDRLEAISRHLHSCLYNLLNLGRGAQRIAYWLDTERPRHWSGYLGRKRNGFVPLLETHALRFNPASDSWGFFLRRRESFLTEVVKHGELTAAGSELFAILTDRVRALGAEPVFVIGPSINHQWQLAEAHRNGEIPCVLFLNRADFYPELYEVETRYDLGYLNSEGARQFSEYLGELFGELLEEREQGR